MTSQDQKTIVAQLHAEMTGQILAPAFEAAAMDIHDDRDLILISNGTIDIQQMRAVSVFQIWYIPYDADAFG